MTPLPIRTAGVRLYAAAVRLLAACSLGGAGHLGPLVPFLDAARVRGDETLVVGPPALADMVSETGHTFWPGGEPDEGEIALIREQLRTAPREKATVLGNRDLFGRLAATAMLPDMERAVREWSPSLVLREPCEYASAVVAGPLEVPVLQVAISLAEAEAGSIRAAEPALEGHRVGVTDEIWRTPYLTRFPASLDPTPFPTTVRIREAGPAGSDRSLPDHWSGSTAPLVYVTFGTVLGHMTTAGEVYRTAVEAVADLDARVLMTTGRRFDASEIGPTPAHVHVEPWIDQREVLGHVDLVVCHGGSGTVLGALAAGVPLVVVPLFADQFENSRRVADAGAGVTVDLAGAGIRAGIDDVLGAATFRERAAGLSVELASQLDVGDLDLLDLVEA